MSTNRKRKSEKELDREFDELDRELDMLSTARNANKQYTMLVLIDFGPV